VGLGLLDSCRREGWCRHPCLRVGYQFDTDEEARSAYISDRRETIRQFSQTLDERCSDDAGMFLEFVVADDIEHGHL
jgi:hypothetical protein